MQDAELRHKIFGMRQDGKGILLSRRRKKHRLSSADFPAVHEDCNEALDALKAQGVGGGVVPRKVEDDDSDVGYDSFESSDDDYSEDGGYDEEDCVLMNFFR